MTLLRKGSRPIRNTKGEAHIGASVSLTTQQSTFSLESDEYDKKWVSVDARTTSWDEKRTQLMVQADYPGSRELQYKKGRKLCITLGCSTITSLFRSTEVYRTYEARRFQVDPHLADANGRLVPWQLRLSEFHFDLIHRAAMRNQAADILSLFETGGTHTTKLDHDLPEMMGSLVE